MDILAVVPLVVVTDVARSVAFYRRFGLYPTVEWETYARLAGDGGAVLHVAAEGDAPDDRPTVPLAAPRPDARPAALVVVQVPDCRAACAALESAGVELLTAPAEPPWGGEVRAFVRDPDGHLIEINERRP